jgi:Na+-driven multidrug efflux pump
MTDRASDLRTLQGEPKKAIRSMFFAFIIAEAVVQVNQFVDTFWVSGLGTTSASAVATVSPVYSLMTAAGIGIALGATTTIAFRLGKGEKEAAGRLAGSAVALGILLAIIAAIITAVFLKPAIWLMGAEDVEDEAVQYMVPLIVMCPVLLSDAVLGGTLRGEGAARKSTAMQASAAVFNMVLDPLFIYALGLEVAGAGIATAAATLLSLSIGIYWYVSGRTAVRISRGSVLHPDRAAAKEVLGVGGPKTGQQLVSDLTDLLQRVFIIIAGGTSAVMLYNYPWRYMGLAQLPSHSLEKSMVPVCSAAYGQARTDKMRTAFSYAAKLSISASVVLAAAMFLLADPLMAVMTLEDSMREMRPDFVKALRICVLALPFSAMMGIGASFLQSMKKARVPMNFYIIWGLAKLALYAIACQYSIWAILWCMVAIHIAGGVCLMAIAVWEFRGLEARAPPAEAGPGA